MAARREAMEPFTDVLDLAAAIGKTARLALYTNNGPLMKHHFGEVFPEAAAIFATRYCSYEFASKKPDPASFRRLLEKLDAAPGDCWFIDDKRSNVQGARMAGLIGHHYRSYEPLLAEARSLGLVS